jgi:hypothetical protein
MARQLEGHPTGGGRMPTGYLPAPPHDATGHTWHHPDALLVEITRLGTAAVVGGGYRSNMPGFGEVLSDDEIVAVLAFIKSTWPPRIIEIHDRLNASRLRPVGQARRRASLLDRFAGRRRLGIASRAARVARAAGGRSPRAGRRAR